ncbi:hypothetical protein [Aulosira sp. FACHB-615]|uniref:hypothetical protein n=1 Tax=Aulosira sp. FACHB-615 TaxID=2692777 RepID=UPI0016861518|nr:hypothetical protein [Aulosira sp. FACHB-615]MBD2489033.1 hypothetical protein [Aulosira sp. FACHB-615]
MNNINISQINAAIAKSFDVAVDALADSCQNALADDIWDWPRQTVRRNGDVVGSPRDRVDSEELIDSLVISRSANAAELTWEADHAAIVHDGATTQNGAELPGTPWTKVGIENCDVAEVMQRQLNKLL